jgi:cytochrome c oxidase assembly protein subunit 15
MSSTAKKIIVIWLITGCVLIFLQVIIGGVTRLTGSGLSITEWKPIVGAVPPLNESQWIERFDEYKQIVQFKEMNQDMTLSEFKFIFFWEYFHRLWARLMGFVFIIPFAYFLLKKWLDKKLIGYISAIVIWGGVVGLYGWIMVKNGLTGLFVPPIFLSIHLILALSLFAYLVWISTYVATIDAKPNAVDFKNKNLLFSIFILVFIQIFMGGLVSGSKAGLSHPTWPDMSGELIPSTLMSMQASFNGLLHYDPTDFWARTFIQFAHRSIAYIILLMTAIVFLKNKNTSNNITKTAVYIFIFSVFFQVIIGILTVLNCKGGIPVFRGVMHQVGAMLLIASCTFLLTHSRR